MKRLKDSKDSINHKPPRITHIKERTSLPLISIRLLTLPSYPVFSWLTWRVRCNNWWPDQCRTVPQFSFPFYCCNYCLPLAWFWNVFCPDSSVYHVKRFYFSVVSIFYSLVSLLLLLVFLWNPKCQIAQVCLVCFIPSAWMSTIRRTIFLTAVRFSVNSNQHPISLLLCRSV